MAQTNRPQAETLSGSPQPNFSGYAPKAIKAKRAPTASDTGYDIGQEWVDNVGDNAYILVAVAAGQANWAITGGASVLGVQTINSLPPTSGNIVIAGSANQIAASNAGSTVTLSTIGPYAPSTFAADGVLYGNGTSAIGATTVGTSGQVLTSNGIGMAPTFQASTGGISTLTGGSGGAISPSAGNITLAGTANQITTTGSGSTITWSLPATVIAPGTLTSTGVFTSDTTTNIGTGANSAIGIGNVSGSTSIIMQTGSGGCTIACANAGLALRCGTGALNISTDAAVTTVSIGTGGAAKTVVLGSTNSTSTTTIQAGSGDIALSTDTNLTGNLTLTTAGNKINIATGSNASAGVSDAMSSGTVTVATTAVTANSLIFCTANTLGGTALPNSYYASTITPGVSFVITSSFVSETSTINWWIIN